MAVKRSQSTQRSPATVSCGVFFPTAVVLQWILIIYLLQANHLNSIAPCPLSSSVGTNLPPTSHALSHDTTYDGVAVALMLKRPFWYWKRYNVMMHNVLSNIPQTWALQLFVYDQFWNEVLGYHRGLRRLVEHPRVHVHLLPEYLKQKKPNVVLKNRFVWEHAIADRVLIFNGDGVLCSNSQASWKDLEDLDYVGLPWDKGVGGNGATFSLRNRRGMLAAIEFTGRSSAVSQDIFAVETLLAMNQRGFNYRLADEDQQNLFGGTHNLVDANGTVVADESWGPLVISGTMGDLPQQARNWAMGKCPEIKQIFPSMHHPSCFGARPNPRLCAEVMGLVQTNETIGVS